MMTNGNKRITLKEEMDYFETPLHSPTDSSEDSVEVKISPISLRVNKRKLSEPRKVPETSAFQGPLKKRMCLKVKAESEQAAAPFRPWSPKPEPFFRPPSPLSCADQPVDLIKKRDCDSDKCDSAPRVPQHPPAALPLPEAEAMLQHSGQAFPNLKAQQRREQRNYKNMTRERRIEANARERTRVHTISAAFDTLRRSIPSYSHNQKLSKLSVLRIACSYIMTLSSIVGGDEDETAECVEMVTKTIQREGKLRKKKDDND